MSGLALALLFLNSCAPTDETAPVALDPLAAQRAFFEEMSSLCGQTFGGRTILAEESDTTFEPARLYFTVENCGDDELRMPFVVGDDDSRTWILSMEEGGLTFVHEHLRPDGTPYENSGFGGRASGEGSDVFQHFPDFQATEETPAAERRVWRLRLDREYEIFHYYLDRGGRPAYRLVFHLGPPSPAP
ncbi:MAG: hypothetical protein EA421_11530 [Gemmatimonadales bacterium]|nr:MAG: hypothetical protein EA421_11530 [Gemmatimonadales bacterium]